MRQDLQVKLLQRDQQLASIKSSLSNSPAEISPSELGVKGSTYLPAQIIIHFGKNIQHPIRAEVQHFSACIVMIKDISISHKMPHQQQSLSHVYFILSSVIEKKTCRVQIPKGNIPRKQGWKEVVSLLGRDRGKSTLNRHFGARPTVRIHVSFIRKSFNSQMLAHNDVVAAVCRYG